MEGGSEEKRQQFRRAAYEIATYKLKPSSWVHLLEVARKMEIKDLQRDEDLRDEFRGIVRDLQEEGDIEGYAPTHAQFRLTPQGIGKVEGE